MLVGIDGNDNIVMDESHLVAKFNPTSCIHDTATWSNMMVIAIVMVMATVTAMMVIVIVTNIDSDSEDSDSDDKEHRRLYNIDMHLYTIEISYILYT